MWSSAFILQCSAYVHWHSCPYYSHVLWVSRLRSIQRLEKKGGKTDVRTEPVLYRQVKKSSMSGLKSIALQPFIFMYPLLGIFPQKEVGVWTLFLAGKCILQCLHYCD